MAKALDIAYKKLADDLRRDILSGKYQPGQKLPGEPKLAIQYGVSRITVRLAMKMLENESLINRRRGSGTFVNPNPERAMPVAHSRFYTSIENLAPRMKRVTKEFKWIEADKQLSIDLNIPEGASVLWFLRVDQASDEPLAYDEGWIFGPFAHKLGKPDLCELEFFEHWQRVQDFHASKSVLELKAITASKKHADILNIRRSLPLLVETSYIFAETQGVAKFVTWYRHDIYRFQNTVHLYKNSSTGDKNA